MVLAVDGKVAGVAAAADPVKENAKKAVARMRKLGIEVALITGDNQKTADSIGKQVGIERIFAEVLPEDKAKERIRNRAKKEGRKDDASDDVINKRFDEYHEKTFPLVDFYKKSRKLIKVDADLGMEGVLKSIVKKLGLKEVKKKKDEKI